MYTKLRITSKSYLIIILVGMSYQCTIHVQLPVGMYGEGNCTEDKYVFKLVILSVAYV